MNQNCKIIRKMVEKSMRTIELMLFNVVLKHEIVKSNKETFSLKFISSSGTIRGKPNFNKYNKRRIIFFKEKLLTPRFVRYIGRTSSGKNSTHCTTYLKAKTKLMNGERRTIYNNLKLRATELKLTG